MAENIHKQPINQGEEAQADLDIQKDTDDLLVQKIELRLGEGQGLYDAIIDRKSVV